MYEIPFNWCSIDRRKPKLNLCLVLHFLSARTYNFFSTILAQIKLVNFLHKVPRFSYPDNVEIILTEDRWDYVLGTLLLPAGLAILFLIWATVLVISKCTAVQPRDHKPSEEKKRTESRCRTTSLLAFLWSFIFMAICSFLYTSQGALKTKESFYRISEEVKVSCLVQSICLSSNSNSLLNNCTSKPILKIKGI